MKVTVTPAAQAQTDAAETVTPDEVVKRPPTVHFLKSHPKQFSAAKMGLKPFEIRRDDRTPSFETDDVVVMQEFDPDREAYTGSGWLVFAVGYVERSTCVPQGFCGFALEKASARQKSIATNAAMNGHGSK